MGRVVVRRLGLLVTGGGAVVRSGRHCCGCPLQATRLAVETGRVRSGQAGGITALQLDASRLAVREGCRTDESPRMGQGASSEQRSGDDLSLGWLAGRPVAGGGSAKGGRGVSKGRAAGQALFVAYRAATEPD